MCVSRCVTMCPFTESRRVIRFECLQRRREDELVADQYLGAGVVQLHEADDRYQLLC